MIAGLILTVIIWLLVSLALRRLLMLRYSLQSFMLVLLGFSASVMCLAVADSDPLLLTFGIMGLLTLSAVLIAAIARESIAQANKPPYGPDDR